MDDPNKEPTEANEDHEMEGTEQECEIQYKYYTKIFEFKNGFRDKVKSFTNYAFDDDFRQHIESYVPIKQHESLVRLDDTKYKKRKTIELLYTLGLTPRARNNWITLCSCDVSCSPPYQAA